MVINNFLLLLRNQNINEATKGTSRETHIIQFISVSIFGWPHSSKIPNRNEFSMPNLLSCSCDYSCKVDDSFYGQSLECIDVSWKYHVWEVVFSLHEKKTKKID